MLKGISPLISPELLKTLAEMGHGDEIILSDAQFPAHSMGIPVLRADGIRVAPVLDAILPLFELDAYVDAPVVMMAAVPGDTLDQSLLDGYRAAIEKHAPDAPATAHIDRFDFYERARKAFAVVVTGETGKYGNILLKKGVTPVK